jgi:hypothetical protein
MATLKLIWTAWKGIAHKIANFQARLVLSFFYFVIVAPFALRVRIFSDPLQLSTSKGWLPRVHTGPDTANDARRQH